MKIEKRKCVVCKCDIRLDKDEFVPERVSSSFKYYHKKCFIEKQTTKKKNKLTLDECLEIMNKNMDEYLQEKNSKHKKRSYSASSRLELTDFILHKYSMTYLQKSFYVYLDSILSGKSSKVSRPIPPEDLLDMWKQKSDYLDEIADRNLHRGNLMYGESRIRYDMAVLLNKYDSYLDWKEKKKRELAANEERKLRDIEKVDYNILNTKSPKNEVIDIASMLDDI